MNSAVGFNWEELGRIRKEEGYPISIILQNLPMVKINLYSCDKKKNMAQKYPSHPQNSCKI